MVDGTLLAALPQMMEASLRKKETGSGMVKWRLHTHFEAFKNSPARMDLAPNGGCENDERAMKAKVLEPDRLYVMDRGYKKFALFNQIVTARSSYVCRLRDNSKLEVERVVSPPQGTEIGEILSDEVVTSPQKTLSVAERCAEVDCASQPIEIQRRLISLSKTFRFRRSIGLGRFSRTSNRNSAAWPIGRSC